MADLIRWDPFKDLFELKDVFDRFFSRNLPLAAKSKKDSLDSFWAPAVDVYDKKDRIIVKAELPGVDKKDVKITVDDDILTISGETKREEEVKEKDYYCSERIYGSFSRSVTLPVAVERDKVKASYKNGVLTIDLPKSKEAKGRVLEIPIE
ncbi:MAG: Hsp20/alpha crystallin family protein [Elusimicrobia bacterium]|nr:Hsp20/alpha crystallin family protein [Elusimicrobiota bacterium]